MDKEELEAIKRRCERMHSDVLTLMIEVEKLQRLLCWWVDRAILPPESSAEDFKIVSESREMRKALGEE